MSHEMLIMFFALFLLIDPILCFSQSYIMTPSGDSRCTKRLNQTVRDTITVGYSKITLKIRPNMSNEIDKPLWLCPVTVVQPVGRLLEGVESGYRFSYWYTAVKVTGDFSSCNTYLIIADVAYADSHSEHLTIESEAKRIDCRTRLPLIIYGKKRQLAILWVWPLNAVPRLTVEILPYVNFLSADIHIRHKIKTCKDVSGFWCGSDCIHGRMYCNGINDCDIFHLKQQSLNSIDELNCSDYKNISEAFMAKNYLFSYESSWINMSLYIFLSFVGIVLCFTAIKIVFNNIILASRLKTQAQHLHSSAESLASDDADAEKPYEEIHTCSDSKGNLSITVSYDEETHEELLGTPSECQESDYFNTNFHPNWIPPKKKSNSLVRPSDSKNFANVQVHSLSSYFLTNNMSNDDISLSSQKKSITAKFLAQSQNTKAGISSPGSARTFRRVLDTNQRTSSYDKIHIQPENHVRHVSVPVSSASDSKSKSYTLSRLERTRSRDKDEYTNYVII